MASVNVPRLAAERRDQRVYCGRPGCGAPLGEIVAMGQAGRRTAWRIAFGVRWLWRWDLDPPRWRRGSHARAYPERAEAESPQNDDYAALPVTVECPRCRAVQRVEP